MITATSPHSRSITGVMMNYYHICHAELWYFAHDINMNYESDIVAQGRLVNEEHYTRDTSKEEFALEGIKLDRVTSDGYIHEVKKSDRAETAHLWQLKYYLWVLKQNGFGDLKGILEFPLQRKRVEVSLTEEDEQEIGAKREAIHEIVAMPQPPKAKKIPFCRQCSYRELCWG
jgi:CRISPR-associated exonuclease Cas4